MSGISKTLRKAGPDLAIKFSATAIQQMLTKNTVQSFFRGQFRKLTTGSREKPFQPVLNAEMAADEIISILQQQAVKPKMIGIDGIPGAGKSTLGRTLADRLSLNWRTLTWQEMQQDFEFDDTGIYENIRLIRTQDIEKFDLLIYLDIPAELARKRVIDRDRNGMLADVVRFDRMKKVGDVAFELLEGNEFATSQPYVRIKIPSHAFNHMHHIHAMMNQKGLLWDPSMNKEEKLFALCYGKPKKGVLAYANYGAYSDVFISAMNATLEDVFHHML